ncbi:MAG: cell division protein FtsA [Candidatus Cloacimonas sp.]|nr:cell division protein FtsA [Candidatus Cloacimonadota bacterium]
MRQKFKATQERIITAVDLGTTKISVIIATLLENGKLELKGVGESPSCGLENGLVKDIIKASESIKKAISEAEEKSNYRAENIYVGIAGEHIKSTNANSRLSIEGKSEAEPGEITQENIDKVVKIAEELVVTQLGDKNQRIIHAIPQYFEVDNQNNIINPINMSGMILTAHVHVVMADVSSLRNINKCFELINYDIEKIVLESLASSKAVLTDDETFLGCVLLDIGGGTTDIAAFFKESIRFSLVVPLGGANITNDIRSGLSTTPRHAEMLKTEFGDVLVKDMDEQEMITVEGIGGREEEPQKRSYLIRIMESRLREILEIAYKAISDVNYRDFMSAGIILTGGTSLLKNIEHSAKDVFNLSVRIGYPNLKRFVNPEESLKDPRYSTSVGLLYYAADNYNKAETKSKGIIKHRQFDNIFTNLFKKIQNLLIDFT